MQGCEFVIGGRDDRHEVLADDGLPLGIVQCLFDAGVHDAHFARSVLHVVVHELRVILGANACQIAALRLGNAQTLEGVLDVVGHGVPIVLLIGVGLHVRDDVVHIKTVDARSPGGVGKAIEDVEGLEAQLEHPFGLVLFGRDLAHNVGGDAGGKALEALFAVGKVIEAAVDIRYLGTVLCHA